MLTFANGGSSPARILGKIPFRLPSEVHSALRFLPQSHHLRLSERKESNAYSLFLIGLQYFSTVKILCQASISRNINSSFLIRSALNLKIAVK